jgi:hypothetical protein
VHISGVVLCHTSRASLLLAHLAFTEPQGFKLAKLLTHTVDFICARALSCLCSSSSSGNHLQQ